MRKSSLAIRLYRHAGRSPRLEYVDRFIRKALGNPSTDRPAAKPLVFNGGNCAEVVDDLTSVSGSNLRLLLYSNQNGQPVDSWKCQAIISATWASNVARARDWASSREVLMVLRSVLGGRFRRFQLITYGGWQVGKARVAPLAHEKSLAEARL